MIEGKVAQILSESRVIINVGQAAGVKEGMLFVILAEGGEVKDPDTGRPLGKWEMPKGRVRVIHVQEKLSLCGAIASETPSAEPDATTHTLSASMVAVSMPGRLAPKLNVRQADISGLPEVSAVRVGDRVRSVEQA
jgi:hypothetical protein